MKIIGAVLDQIQAPRPYRASQPLAPQQLVLDEPRAGEVRVAIDAAGVCHSDLSVIDGNRPRPLPMVLGHEGAGRVEALGDDIDDLRVGQRVVMSFFPDAVDARAAPPTGGCRAIAEARPTRQVNCWVVALG